ncbi:MAG: Uma2 family endonuclease [Acidobacteria bacterium]|nr:Uma2 family endonuclease [Acidobacteriota bacterium]
MSTASTLTMNVSEIVEQLPTDSTLILRHVSWEDYEELLDAVGEAKGLRISYDGGTLQIMTVSAEHESYADLIKLLVGQLSLKLRIKVLFFGSATMKKRRQQKGSEPDACFYIQSADLIGRKRDIDFNSDPPPDIVVEVDIHHDSLSKFPIYAALGVPELWRYHGQALTIYHLQEDQYVPVESSQALPLLTSRTLTEFLNRSQHEDQYETLLAFEQWLQARQP